VVGGWGVLLISKIVFSFLSQIHRPQVEGMPATTRYATFVDQQPDPTIFVVDRSVRAYPAYVVTYAE
jgi:hypothetical protein